MNKTEIIEEFKKLTKLYPTLLYIEVTFNGGSDDGWANEPYFGDTYGRPLQVSENVFNSRETWYYILKSLLGSGWTNGGSVCGTINISENGVEVYGERDEPVPFNMEME